MFKKIIPLFIGLFSIALINAQSFSVPSTIHTPYGNVRTYTNVYMPMYYKVGGQIPLRNYNYTVILDNDSICKGRGRLFIKKGLIYLRLRIGNGTKSFMPKDTKEVYILKDGFIKVMGIPSFNDSCWLFKVANGRINRYAIAPELGTDFISAVQKGENAPLLKLTKETLVEMVKDNPKALKKAKKGKYTTALDIYNDN